MAAFTPLSPMATMRWQVVRGVLDRLAPERVLEIGCGQGGFGARIAATTSYVGVEPDAQSCALAQQRVQPFGGDVRHGTSDLVGEDEQFDLVCAFEVIEHLEDDGGALRDWIGHLETGGSVLVSVPAWPDRFGPMDKLVGHYRRYTPASLTAVLQAAGCTQIKVIVYGWPLGYALEVARNQIALRRGTASEDGAPSGSQPAGQMAQRSATSGRLLQPRGLAGTAVRIGVAPFAALQRLRPTAGTGLVAFGQVNRSANER